MINLSPEFCKAIGKARRAAGISQSALAREVGCKQPALSPFEAGDGTKLNEDVIRKLAAKFNIELPKETKTESAPPVRPIAPALNFESPVVARMMRGFCPNPSCPSNHAYRVGDMTFVKPDREAADPVGGKYCALCGEILEKKCPNCGAPVHDGAVCSLCGEPYVSVGYE